MKKILLIDDNQDMHLMVGYILKKAGFQMISAMDGTEGLEKLRSEQPDLVILDFMMPGKDGKQVFEEFATLPRYKQYRNIPFIMLTARQTNKRDREKLLRLGMAAFLTKPFGQKELLNVIENILTTHKLRLKEQNLLEMVSDARDFLAKLVESIPNALFIVDNAGTITFYNGGHKDVLGFEIDEVLNSSFQTLLCGSEINLIKASQMLNSNELMSNVELMLCNKAGQEVPFSFSAASFREKSAASTVEG